MKKRVLGRGLEALISQEIREGAAETESVKELKTSSIDPNPDQPRKNFRKDELEKLASSIAENGMLQPIVVRRKGKRYQVVVGERRLRASEIAGKELIPCLVRDINDEDSLKLALLENLQREDLNPLEEAGGYQSLVRELGLSANEIGRIVGKSRSAVTNTMRLLKLPGKVKEMIASGELREGHARALLSVKEEEEQIKRAEKIVKENLSVRDVERSEKKQGRRTRGKKKTDPAILAIEEKLEVYLGTRTRIKPSKKGGVLAIEYFSNEQLEGILERIGIDLPL
ncbi:MAG: ParB/RepB/Spo0J family partition protein [Candidatus Krumholzibacteriota bacterium]|nr:ParB/RepB/Spo0J family partition protein [Candidatus Krumholzibacteriota bacterium]